MSLDNYYAVILAGGKGERFWPLSTSKTPKQLLSLVGDRALLAQAVDRLKGLIPPERVLVVTNADLVEGTRKAAPELPPDNIIGEPMGRDTAPAVALSAALVKARNPEGCFCILTADHIIGNIDVFQTTLRESLDIASKEDVLITIGIEPTEPATGYGYIHLGDEHTSDGSTQFQKVQRFVEKPDIETARQYVEDGQYSWNSGMFIWSVKSIESALTKYTPDLGKLIDPLAREIQNGKLNESLARYYEPIKKISIDYAVMEKADNILAARGTFAWDDVGSWTALVNHFPLDDANNTKIGNCEEIDASGNIVYSKDRLTTLIGVNDMIVVQADGVTMICPKERGQDIKAMVSKLRESGNYDEVL